jgi:enoyl-CoA hydratase
MGVGYNQAAFGFPMMSFEHLLVERRGAVGLITINRPKVLNALSAQTIDELRQALLSLRHDAAVRAVVVTGSGEKAFVAGADIGELATLSSTEAKDYSLRGQHVLNLVEHLEKPVIAAVNGFALGGGCELAMACTLRFAAGTARFGQPEIKLGTLPGFGGSQRLPRLVGKGRALELLLTGRMIDAEEALRIGLVTRVVPAGDLVRESLAMAGELASAAPLAVRYVIEAVTRGLEMSLADGSLLEASLFGLAASTEDMHEGTQAFLDKRKPTFGGK